MKMKTKGPRLQMNPRTPKDEISTGNLLNRLLSTHSESELSDCIQKHTVSDSKRSFSALFEEMIAEKHLNRADIIRHSLIDRTYAYQILSGIRLPGRDKVLALGISAGLSLKEIQRLLEYSELGILYPKSARDAILIYGIEHHFDVMKINELLEAHQQLCIP